MRSFLWLLIAATFWSTGAKPAQADITANYHAWGPIGPELKVQVADNGDARVEMRGEVVAIRRNGVIYLVRSDERGAFVLTIEEFERIEALLEREFPNLDLPASEDNANIIDAGTEVVGGRTGRVLLFDDGGPAHSTEMAFVVSTDPDLLPVGTVVSRIFGGGAGMPMPQSIRRHLEEIHSRGTLIRMWSMLRLTGTSSERIPPEAFELPGPILTGEEARARLRRAW